MPSLLLDRLDHHADRRPAETAVREIGPGGPGRILTWSALRGAAVRLAGRIRESVPPGGTVLLSSPNQVEFPVAFFGALMAGAGVFPVRPDLVEVELLAAAEKASAAAVIGGPASLKALGARVPAKFPLLGFLAGEDGGAGPSVPAARAFPRNGSLLLQSSGTTGLPKIVRRGARALDAIGENCRGALRLLEGDRMLVALPLSHSYGIDHALLAAVASGCVIEILRSFDLAAMMDVLSRGGATILPAVPFMFEAIAKTGEAPGPFASLRHAYSAGGPLPLAVHEAFHRRFGVRIGQIYGATEFGSVTFNDPGEEGFDPGSAGKPFDGVEIRILDAERPDPARPLPAGREGHVAVASPSMLAEYVGDPRPPAPDGFLLTGDLGRLDGRGRLTLTGRIKLLIDVGGLKVNPMEVEAVLAGHPAVQEAVVVPLPVTETVARLKAIVLLKAGGAADPEEILRFARERLTGYKVPRVIEFRDALPRSPTGKILRRDLG